jgi:hemerythrin-like domain-containing protein
MLFPAARCFRELAPLVEELIADHSTLRKSFSEAGERRMTSESLPAFAQQLSAHIRKEERQLFEGLQQLMDRRALAALGSSLEAALKDAAQSCALPNEKTRLQPKR